MKRILLFVIFISTGVAVATTARAENSLTTPNADRLLHRMERRLDITEVQRAQIKALLQQERPTLQQLHVQLASERAELRALPAFDEAQTRAVLNKYADANAAALVESEKMRQNIYALLTPVQRQKLDGLRSRFAGAFDQRLSTLGDNL